MLNIIHPYTFKLDGKVMNIGPCEEFEERDRKVALFTKKTLSSGRKVLLHKYHNGDQIRHLMHETALKADPIYDFLFDSAVDYVITSPYGTPISDKKPEDISQKTWNYMKSIFTSHSELEQKIGNPKVIIFIGGVLENCIANAAYYFHNFYRKDCQRIVYIPELCVSLDQEAFIKIKPVLEENKIEQVDYDKAVKMLE